MNTNSRSEQVWDLLHATEALVKHRGFQEAGAGPAPRGNVVPPVAGQVSLAEVALRFQDRLILGSQWPVGNGPAAPMAIVLTKGPLGGPELEFVRSWFENPKVNVVLEEQLYLQILPDFMVDNAPWRDWAQALCDALTPRALFCLGLEPARLILGAPLSMETLRNGDFTVGKTPLLTTLEPADFLSLPAEQVEARQKIKAAVWKDLQRLVGKLRYG
ncbi:MAG: hypothetical protein WCG80_18385 [Spirochaetales bacterium]